MAKIGLDYVAVGKLADDVKTAAAATYTDAKYMGTSVTLNGNVTMNDVKDYGDNRTVETDTSFQSGTLSWEKNDLADEDYAYLLGHTYDEKSKEVTSKADDIPPFLGVGVVGKSKRNGEHVYVAKFYLKTQFHEPNDENSTKQDTTTFAHETVEGAIFELEDGAWKLQKTFSGATALADAKSWVNTKLGITAAAGGGTVQH